MSKQADIPMTGLVILRSTIWRTAGSSVAASVSEAGWMDERDELVEADDDELEDAGESMAESMGGEQGQRMGHCG